MSISTVIGQLDEGETIGVRLFRPGELILDLGREMTFWVYEKHTPEAFADICKRFDLETAPELVPATEEGPH